MTPDQIAPVVHEAIRALQAVLGQEPAPPWNDATWQRDSTLQAVEAALANPDPAHQHERWMQERLAAGWTYGPVREDHAKKNPLLIPFEELPPFEKAKDALIVAISQTLKDIPA